MGVVLSKHHGLGNDFLVLDLGPVSSPSSGDVWAAAARRWCDRRTGVGADGLLLLTTRTSGSVTTGSVTPGSVRIGMALHNADGSRAEMSGNGIRCLVHAAHRSLGGVDGARYVVSTDAGDRDVTVSSGSGTDTLELEVDMGAVLDLPVPQGWELLECHPDRPVRHLSLGNPHSVVGVDDVDEVDLVRLGSLVPHVNLEIVAPGPEPDAVTMRVHERGVGITSACGTGACAAADAAVSWGLVPASAAEVLVHMPGGDARVRIDRATRRAILIGPSTFVALVPVADDSVADDPLADDPLADDPLADDSVFE